MEKPEHKSKSVDWPSLIVSLIALIVAGFSCSYSRDQLKISSGQVRAYIQVVDVKLVESIDSSSFFKVKLTIKNFGQTAAIDVSSDMDYNFIQPDTTGNGNLASARNFKSIAPGLEKTYVIKSNKRNFYNWPAPNSRNPTTIYFFGTIWYTDDTTKEKRKYDWCYELSLKTEKDLKRLDLEESEWETYTSKDK